MNYFITLISVLSLLCQLQAQPKVRPDCWMGDLSPSIHQRTLASLVLPGAYRSGLQRIKRSTALPDRCSVQSQEEAVRGLLDQGARYLDFQVVCWRGQWYLGAFSYSLRDGLQIAAGQTLDDALEDVSAFLSEKKHCREVVVIHLSRYIDSKLCLEPKSELEATRELFADNAPGMIDPARKQELLALCRRKLSAVLCHVNDPLHTSLDSVLASVNPLGPSHGAAVVLMTEYFAPGNQADAAGAGQCLGKDAIRVSLAFTKTDSLKVLLTQWDAWQKSPAGCYRVAHWVLSWKNSGSPCNRTLAGEANKSLNALLDLHPPASGAYCTAFFDPLLASKLILFNTKPIVKS